MQGFRLKFTWMTLTMLCLLVSNVRAEVDFSHLIEQVTPAVVSVIATKTTSQEELLQQQMPEVFKRFFGPELHIPQPQQRQAYGSAFFISHDGYLLTNRHVVQDASKVSIRFHDRRELDAELIGSDERTDIALLKVKGTQFPALQVGDAEQLKVGEPVLAIGSPFGFDYSASAGIVSAKSRTMVNEAAVPFIQTDAALNPGNSGGPLFNQHGQVVGVNSRIFSGTGGYMGLSFSIPIDVAMDVVQQLKSTGRVTRPFLGVLLQDIDRDLAEAYQLSKPEGALVSKVSADSPAEAAGLKAGDIILAYNQQALLRTSDLIHLINRSRINQQVELLVLREGQRRSIKAKLSAAPDDQPKPIESSQTQKENINYGLRLRALSEQEQSKYKLHGVLVQEVQYGSAAERAGIMRYDVISRINNTQIHSLDEFKQAMAASARQAVVAVYLIRREQPLVVGLRLKAQ